MNEEHLIGDSIVRRNLMERKGYSPYCGLDGKCHGHWPRTKFDGEQFVCPSCGWRSKFPATFIKAYRDKWGIKARPKIDRHGPAVVGSGHSRLMTDITIITAMMAASSGYAPSRLYDPFASSTPLPMKDPNHVPPVPGHRDWGRKKRQTYYEYSRQGLPHELCVLIVDKYKGKLPNKDGKYPDDIQAILDKYKKETI